MIGQNFFNYVDFMIDKIFLYVDQAKKLTNSSLTNLPELTFYPLRSSVWYCNYRERPNTVTIDDNFISSVNEKDQGWSEWKYGLPTDKVNGLQYVPREQPDLQYLGQTFTYNPKSQVFFINEAGQDILSMGRDAVDIGNFNRISNVETSLFSDLKQQRYFVIKENKFIPFLSVKADKKTLGGDHYYEYTLKNKEFYTEENIRLSRDFKFPKLKWGSSNEFLLYYDPFDDPELANDYLYINPSYLIIKANVPRLFSGYDKNRDGNYTETLARYNIPDFSNNKVVSKTIDTSIKTVNSCYITSDDNSKVFEVVVSRFFIVFEFRKDDGTISWEVQTKLNNKFIGFNDAVVSTNYFKKEKIEGLRPSRFNLDPLDFTRIDKAYLNSLALMEHIPAFPQITYIEPFIYQPGTLPASNRWQPNTLDQTGGYPRGLSPTSVELNSGGIEYKFDFKIKESGGDFEKLPNPKNESKYDFSKYNIVPTSELIL